MGNNAACKTQGIGSIRLKLHNGSIRVLTEVRYVPDLKKNLLSLETLDLKGFKITIQDGVLKVVLGALVVMKGIRRGNLYFLQGSTIDGGASTICQKLDEDNIDETRLWHMRLGHAGEKALQSLTK